MSGVMLVKDVFRAQDSRLHASSLFGTLEDRQKGSRIIQCSARRQHFLLPVMSPERQFGISVLGQPSNKNTSLVVAAKDKT
jgi:hypothetical protein